MADIAALADPRGWASAAARLLANLGFSLIHSDQPSAIGGSFLLVAFRSSPTFRHFDPEALSFWQASGGRGRLVTIDRSKPFPVEAGVSWGRIRIVDRLGIDNRFLTFGGVLRSAVVDDELTVVSIESPGPLARWSGHSQGSDPLASEIGAFFGRLLVRVDFEPGIEGRLAGTPAIELYAAFVRNAHARLAAAAQLRQVEPGFAIWVGAEATRLERSAPDAWRDGEHLLAELDLGR
jgi:hypothetical protein